MTSGPIPTTLDAARRLAVVRQHLAGRRPARSSGDPIVALLREIAYVQWDPVSIVAPSHLLALWNRVGGFRPGQLDRLLWRQKRLFLHWIPVACLVLTEDYPLYASLMARYPDSLSSSWGSQRERTKRFLAAHTRLRSRILRRLRDGPLTVGGFEEHQRTRRSDGEWTPSSDVAQLLSHLTLSGRVMVVGHEGNQNLWGLTDGFLPASTDRRPLRPRAFERAAAERTIRALGTASAREVHLHFVRGRYLDLPGALRDLEDDGRIVRIHVAELGARDERFVHADDLPLLERLRDEPIEPRVSLLPPFDNLVHSPARTQRLFGFDYVREQFLPKERRRFGTYVLPILWGDRLIGRMDARLESGESRSLVVNGLFAESSAPDGREVAAPLRERIAELAEFLGASRIRYPRRVPAVWNGVRP